MTWVKTQGVFTNKPWHKSWLVSKSRSESRCRSARRWLAPRLSFEYLNWYLFYKYKKLLSQKHKYMCWQVFLNKYIYNRLSVLEYIVLWTRCVILVVPSRNHILAHPWTAMLLSWIRDDVTIVAIDSEWKNVTQTKRRRDMRLTSWLKSRLNRVSMIFLCEYDLTWTQTESQMRLGPGPSQVLSQVSSQDC